MTALTRTIGTLLGRRTPLVPELPAPPVPTRTAYRAEDFFGVDGDVQVNYLEPVPAPARNVEPVVKVDTSTWTLDEMLQVAG